jgi:ABC-type Fe3+/spermidine/putrescine transport system ATPase subunit
MLSIIDIYKTYEGKPLLRGISFDVHEDETICLLGHSGSGKSTLLRIIAGIEKPEGGKVLWDGEDLVNLAIHKRNFGLMFQDYALFPHKNVFENVAFGLRMLNLSEATIKERVNIELEKVKMVNFAQRRITDLSGGEQQRVALARALAPHPRLLMLDEPLGALDKTLRGQLLKEIRELLHETKIPAIYVTHDQEEAFTIGDQLVLLNEGEIVQHGTPKMIYQNPKNTWVSKFLGFNNIVPGKVTSINPLVVTSKYGDFSLIIKDNEKFSLQQEVKLLLRPNGIQESSGSENLIYGKIIDSIYLGQGFRIFIDCLSTTMEFDVKGDYKIGDYVKFSIDPSAIHCFQSD